MVRWLSARSPFPAGPATRWSTGANDHLHSRTWPAQGEFLYKVARHAADRGMSLLAVDPLGAGQGIEFETIVGRPDLETTIGHAMDYLAERNDVDPARIVILADAWGSSFVARGIAAHAGERFGHRKCPFQSGRVR